MRNCSSLRRRNRCSWLMGVVPASLAFAAMVLPIPLLAAPDPTPPAGVATQLPVGACIWLQQNLAVLVLQGRVPLPHEGDISVDLFRNGTTLVPLSPVFPAALPKGDAGRLNAAIDGWKEGGRRKVFGAIEVLRWAELGNDYKTGPLGKHPAWRAVTQEGTCGGGSGDGAYASPYHPEVRTILVDLASKVGRLLPALDGIILSVNLSSAEALDFSETARVSHIRAIQLDPIDLPLGGMTTADSATRAAYMRWASEQRAACTRILREMAAAYRKEQPKGLVIGMGWAGYYFWGDMWRGAVGGDWLAWARQGLVDELWLAPARLNRISEKPITGVMARALKLARGGGKWPVCCVLPMKPVGNQANLEQDLRQAREEAEGHVALFAESPEHLQWLGIQVPGAAIGVDAQQAGKSGTADPAPHGKAQPAALESAHRGGTSGKR